MKKNIMQFNKAALKFLFLVFEQLFHNLCLSVYAQA